MKLPKNLDLVIGLEDAQVLRAVNYGLRDVDSIHALTGVPRTIVQCKLNVLLGAGFLAKADDGFVIRAGAGRVIVAICGSRRIEK